jgi:hypothetical protein
MGVPCVTYINSDGLDAPFHVAWYDLDSDGAFDLRVIAGIHPVLKNAHSGAQIFLDSEWRDAKRLDGSNWDFTSAGKTYRFLPTAGKRWQPTTSASE